MNIIHRNNNGNLSMAFNWSTFKTRTLTAFIFVAIMLFGMLWSEWSFLLLFSVIHFGCWWEYLKLTEKICKTSFHIYTKMGFMVMGYGLMLCFCGPEYQITNYGLKENFSLPVSAAGFALLLMGIFQKNRINIKTFLMSLAGTIYISLSWGLMLNLHDEFFTIHIHDTSFFPGSGTLPLIIIASIWINDTMAYIVGSMIGRTPLTSISPKKTWEGTIGGVILAVLVTAVLTNFIAVRPVLFEMTVATAIIAAVAATAGTFGDLLESKLKRMAGVKDSGSIMPGHGGFLDRFDSLLLATPAVWLCIKFFMN